MLGFIQYLLFLYHRIIFRILSVFDSNYQHAITLSDRKLLVRGLIASGGFSNVYLVQELNANQEKCKPRALKRVYLSDTEVIKSFQNEVNVYKAVKHPKVMKHLASDVYKMGNNTQVGFILMPYYPEGTLQCLLNEKPNLSPAFYLPFFRDICLGLQAFHSNSIVLRDLKPANILLSNTSPILSDFGSATPSQFSILSPSEAQAFVEDCAIQISAMYRPPECFSVPKLPFHLDERVDTWALGCILYYMMFGFAPFDGSESSARSALKYKIQNKTMAEIVPLLQRMLSTDMYQRPTVVSILDELKPLLSKLQMQDSHHSMSVSLDI